MAHEITPWKEPGCALPVPITELTNREYFSQEVNKEYGEGGALNANYRSAEALAKATNLLGAHLLIYGQDFVFKTTDGENIYLDFRDKATQERAALILATATPVQ